VSYELKIALRFLIKGRAQTIFILFGIALGVAVQIFLGNLITSLQISLIDSTIGNSPHIVVLREVDEITKLLNASTGSDLRGNYPAYTKNLENWQPLADQLEAESGVKAVSPLLQGSGIIRESGKTIPVQLKGIQLEKGDKIYHITSRLIAGNAKLEGNSAYIGTTLAKDLGVAPGGSINVLLPSGTTSQLTVAGVFDLQNKNSNASLIFLDLKRAQSLYGSENAVTSIEVQINDPFIADTIAYGWKEKFSGISLENWKDQNSQLLTALTSQSSSSYTIQFFVIVAVTFGIASVLAVSVVQKSKQIGILKAMGATRKSAARIFIYQGFMLGLAGSLFGTGFGILLLSAFGSANTTFAITVDPKSILLIVFISVAAGTISSLIPARNSSTLNPMEAIRNG
jgi:lipoprotein-releasing system permease protein